MKISELKASLKKFDEQKLQLIVAELYKNIPKEKRERARIDDLVADPDQFLIEKAALQRAKNEVDSKRLVEEIFQFSQDALDGYYGGPNRKIRKKERSNWRFKVQRFLKELNTSQNLINPEVLAKCLEKIYAVLVRGCTHFIFVSEDPFISIGVDQEQVLQDLFAAYKKCGLNRKYIELCLHNLLLGGRDRMTSAEDLIDVFVETLSTAPITELTIKHCENLIEEERETLGLSPKDQYYSSGQSYKIEDRIEKIILTHFYCCMKLGEGTRAVSFYWEYAEKASWPEIDYYRILNLIARFKNCELWKSEYESGVAKGVELREALTKVYEHIKEHQKFPEDVTNVFY